jgi:hypothetical protein
MNETSVKFAVAAVDMTAPLNTRKVPFLLRKGPCSPGLQPAILAPMGVSRESMSPLRAALSIAKRCLIAWMGVAGAAVARQSESEEQAIEAHGKPGKE